MKKYLEKLNKYYKYIKRNIGKYFRGGLVNANFYARRLSDATFCTFLSLVIMFYEATSLEIFKIVIADGSADLATLSQFFSQTGLTALLVAIGHSIIWRSAASMKRSFEAGL